MAWTQNYDPFDSPVLSPLVAALPVVVLLGLLATGRVSAAKAALAANLQGKYQPMHDALMGLKSNLDNATVLQVAGELGLDVAKLQQDMESAAVADELRSVH